MKPEYYVKQRLSVAKSKLIRTCETVEQAHRELRRQNDLNRQSEFYVQYSPEAIQKYVDEGARRFGNG